MWFVKYLVQLVLSYVPGGVRLNYFLQVLKGSHRQEVAATRLVNLAAVYSRLSKVKPIEGSEVLEVGTGWDAIIAITMYLFGAKQVHTFDITGHARFEIVHNVLVQARAVAERFSGASGIPVAKLQERLDRLESAGDLESLFSRAGISYRAPADATHSDLPDASVDLVISYAVLAHLSVPLLDALTVETRRVLRPGGLAFHVIGMEDPYCNFSNLGRVRFLKYPARVWSLFNLNRFNYNNRLREPQYVKLFKKHGASIVEIRSTPDDDALRQLQTLRVDREFSEYPPQELAVIFSEVMLSFNSEVSTVGSRRSSTT